MGIGLADFIIIMVGIMYVVLVIGFKFDSEF